MDSEYEAQYWEWVEYELDNWFEKDLSIPIDPANEGELYR